MFSSYARVLAEIRKFSLDGGISGAGPMEASPTDSAHSVSTGSRREYQGAKDVPFILQSQDCDGKSAS